MESQSPKATIELLKQNGFRFSKSMGQNFIIDGNIPEKIVRLAGIDGSSGVLEVGSGIGALTLALCKKAGHVVAVELDGRLMPVLSEAVSGRTNVEIIHGDILKLDIKKLAKEKMTGFIPCVCANLPYNITTPVLSAFIDAGVFETVTVMVQKEVARRMCAMPGSPDYGAFSVFVNYHTEAEIFFDVPPECFMPRPGVFSSVVAMKARKERLLEPDDEAMFFRVVRASFEQRRKTIVNALHAAFGNAIDKEEIAKSVAQCGHDPRARGETLGIDDFASIAMAIKKNIDENGLMM